ncbi:MAG: P27 family phage terminase small subunit [Gammaproteobacteria bacterium]|nr:MAG: P27 family phage terminase small subunit [Gammaproteobacteria bacterium]
MGGRYPQTDKVAQHPSFDRGAAASAENEQKHIELANELRPKSVTGARRKVWDRVAPELSRGGRLKKIFVDFLVEYCEVKVRIDEARAELDKPEMGWTYETVGRHGSQIKSRPEVAQLNDDWRKWNSLVNQLGLSPATELRFNDKQRSFEFDDFDQF